MRIGSSKSTDMTEGNIASLIMLFSVPLMIGNFFQLLYNMIDAIVVGNFVSKSALGAVGSTGAIVNMVVSIFSGLATGAGAVISQFFGAKDGEKVKGSVHTSLIMTLIVGVLSSLVGVFFADEFLVMMKTPADIFPDALTYLRIYFAGMLGLLFYNMEAGILRAVGDSAHPFYALVASSLVNLVLDLVFVLVFNMGVAGVAYATVLAQFASAGILAVVLVRTNDSHRICFKDVKYSSSITATIIKIGIPTALHLGITAFSNIFVQAYINNFGGDVTTGWSTYTKVDQIIILPVMSISLALTTFVGQNLGAGKIDRVKKGIKFSVLISILICAVLMIPMLIFPGPITKIFSKDKEVIRYGAYLLRLISPFYITMAINQNLAGALRGAGITKVPMIMALSTFVGFRQLYLYVISRLGYGDVLTLVALSYPFGWIICSVAYAVYYKLSHWEEKQSVVIKNKKESEKSENIQ